MFKRLIVLAVVMCSSAIVVRAQTQADPSSGAIEDIVAGQRNVGTSKTVPALGLLLIQRIDVVNDLIDQNALQTALKELKELEQRPGLSPFEEAVIMEMLAFVYGSMGETDLAIEYYEKVLEEEEIPPPMHQGALYTLAHMYSEKEDFEKSIELIWEWFSYEKEPFAEAFMFMGSCHAALENYEEALPWMERAIEDSVRPIEGWYNVTVSLYLTLEKFDKAIPMLKTMLKHWTQRPHYWDSLASAYQVTSDEAAAYDTTMTAYANGMLTDPEKILALVEMSYYNDVPFTAGSILENEMIAGVVPETEMNLQVLIEIWIAAREYDRAIAAIDRIVNYTDAGPYYMRAARLYGQSGGWVGAAESAEKALDAGVENRVQALVVAGSAYSELLKYEEAIEAFRTIIEIGGKEERKNAANWIEFIEETWQYQAQISQ